jgi:thymidine phosphorylase
MVTKKDGVTSMQDFTDEKYEARRNQIYSVFMEEPKFYLMVAITEGNQILLNGHGNSFTLAEALIVDSMLGSKLARERVVETIEMLKNSLTIADGFINDAHAQELALKVRESMRPSGKNINPDHDDNN